MWKLVKVIISGLSIGIACLMLGYIGVYYLAGEVAFAQEIAMLGKIQTLQTQMIITGISGILIALSVYYIEKTMADENAETYKAVVGTIFLTVSAIIAMMLNELMNENISDMMVVISATLVCIYAFTNGVRTLLRDIAFKRNNKKYIKETEKGNS